MELVGPPLAISVDSQLDTLRMLYADWREEGRAPADAPICVLEVVSMT